MKLAIADPPYLGRGAKLYGAGANGAQYFSRSATGYKTRHGERPHLVTTTEHAGAAEWDSPARHARLVTELDAGYDGWAIALARDSLPVYLAAAPDARVAVWVRTNPVPGGSWIVSAWEPVLVRVPAARRALRPAPAAPTDGRADRRPVGMRPRDVLTTTVPTYGHVGAKPPAWTRWVLDMLGYQQDSDTVDDLFPGSGAVSREIAQLVLDGQPEQVQSHD